jgi:putative endonuclease
VLGIRGEKDVLAHLVSLGWRIEAHRFRAGRHDIDLVIRRGTLVAFVEVKTRSSGEFGSGVESVGWKKRKALAWAAAVWVARHGQPGDRYRFDVVTISPARPVRSWSIWRTLGDHNKMTENWSLISDIIRY